MSENIISVDNISKCYQIGRQSLKGEGLRHVLEGALRAPIGWLRQESRAARAKTEDFWAVKDLSFEVKQGEIVGIIGRNGAGKSTILKLLSRITEPTSGRIHLRGRVASLLEVGTGFHPELTGRENIFLNGAILGMTRVEIKRKFDEIVAFAEIDRFLDTPVKRYSSGMYVRLAFAVAAHLEPEILIVDEVLAVGDSEFQKKCLGKMEDVSAKEGRTVLLVSHQIPSIQSLCSRCILMAGGRMLLAGNTDEVLASYAARSAEMASYKLSARIDRSGQGRAKLTSVELLDCEGNMITEAMSGRDITIRVIYSVTEGQSLGRCILLVDIESDHRSFFGLSTALSSNRELRLTGRGCIDIRVPAWPLLGGSHQMHLYLEGDGEAQDVVKWARSINTVDGDFFGTGKASHDGWRENVVLVPHSWQQHDSKLTASRDDALAFT